MKWRSETKILGTESATTDRLQNGSYVVNELFPLWTELVDVDGRVTNEVSQRLVDLRIVGHSSSAEGLDNPIETHLLENEYNFVSDIQKRLPCGQRPSRGQPCPLDP